LNIGGSNANLGGIHSTPNQFGGIPGQGTDPNDMNNFINMFA
jgi:hypothetical protein